MSNVQQVGGLPRRNLFSTTTGRSEADEQLRRTILIALNSASMFARVSCFLLILSTLFARSAWTCKSSDFSACQSLWTIPSQTVSEVFAVTSCVMALTTVLLPFAPAWMGLSGWKWETLWTFVTLVFSLVAWPIVANTLANDYFLSWAFSVSVAGSIAGCLAFGLSFRDRLPPSETQWFKTEDKRIQVLLSTFAVACAFGAMPTLVDVSSKSPQSQAGSFVTVAFFAFQLGSCGFCLNFALPNGFAWARPTYLVLQSFSVVLACIGLGLLSNLNVLPMVIASATQFHVQGFLVGGGVFGLASLYFCILDATGRTRIFLGTRMFLSPWPSVLVCLSSTILGTSLAALYVFVEDVAPSPPNSSSALLVASKAFLVMSSMLCIATHMETVWFLTRPADSRAFVLLTVKRMLQWSVLLILITTTIGFSSLVAFDHAIRFSAAMALSCILLTILFMVVFAITDNSSYILRRNYTPSLKSRQYLDALDENKEIKQARLELLEEREALERAKLRIAMLRSPANQLPKEPRSRNQSPNDRDKDEIRPSTLDLDTA